MKVKYVPQSYRDSPTGKDKIVWWPVVDVILLCNHRVGKPVRCIFDTGSVNNIFPLEYATVFLGFSEETVKSRGKEIDILGVSGAKSKGYGHLCAIHHPDFKLENVSVYFVENQPCPLLGRIGFMDHFEEIILNEKEKTLELTLPQNL